MCLFFLLLVAWPPLRNHNDTCTCIGIRVWYVYRIYIDIVATAVPSCTSCADPDISVYQELAKFDHMSLFLGQCPWKWMTPILRACFIHQLSPWISPQHLWMSIIVWGQSFWVRFKGNPKESHLSGVQACFTHIHVMEKKHEKPPKQTLFDTHSPHCFGANH